MNGSCDSTPKERTSWAFAAAIRCLGLASTIRTPSNPIAARRKGSALLPVVTELLSEKTTRVVAAESPAGVRFEAYEIHMGRTDRPAGFTPFAKLADGNSTAFAWDDAPEPTCMARSKTRLAERTARDHSGRASAKNRSLRRPGGLVRGARRPRSIRGAVPVSIAPYELLAGVSLDLSLGDPRWFPHPVRGFGWLATRLENFWRSTTLPARIAGICFTISAVRPKKCPRPWPAPVSARPCRGRDAAIRPRWPQ